MKALIFSESEAQKFPILNLSGGVWQPLNNTVSGVYWLQLEAEQDLIDNGIEYTIGQIEIKQEEIE
jgi:hypothetical protein